MQTIIGFPPVDLVRAAGLAVAVAVLLFAARLFLSVRLKQIAKRTETELDDLLLAKLQKLRWYFVVAISLRAGATLLELSDRQATVLNRIATVAILVQLGVWGSEAIAFAFAAWSRNRNGSAPAAGTLNALTIVARGILWSIIAVLGLSNVLGIDVTALVTGLGIGGVAIALAVQNILGDLFAALSIVLDRPFEAGDTIAVDTQVGTVERIGLKTTRVRSVSGEEIIFSNTDLLQSRVRNLRRLQERRALLRIGVVYHTPADTIAAIPRLLEELVRATSLTRFDRAHFIGFGDSSLDFELAFFVQDPTYVQYMSTKQDVAIAILSEFNKRSIGFAFPTRTLHVESPVTIEGAAPSPATGAATIAS
jgi:small-conductance mechanosensitive channel